MRRWALRCLLVIAGALIGAELALQASHLLASSRTETVKPGTAVILCIGDSHTYGAGVTAEESYPSQLEDRLKKLGRQVKVVNMGAPGYNTSQLRRHLPEWLSRYQPETVIVLASVNNGWNYADASWSDLQDGIEVPLSTRVRDVLLTKVRLLRFIDILLHRLKWAGPPEEKSQDREGQVVIHLRESNGEHPQAIYNRARRDLAAIAAQCQTAHANLILMTYVTDPVYDFVVPNLLLRQVAAELKIPLADNDKAIRPLFYRDGMYDHTIRDRLFLPDMHPGGAGYSLIVDNLISTMEKAGILRD